MNKIAIVPTIRNDTEIEYLAVIIAKLKKNGAVVYMDAKYSSLSAYGDIVFLNEEDVYKDCEFIIVLGGDGSILRAAEYALKYDVPLLGVNLGRLGYMAGLEKNELDLIENIFSGNYTVEERMMLSVDVVKKDGNVMHIGDALNDVVVGKGGYSHTIDINLVANGKQVRTIRADAVIFATPTGSTAYSMSAGGSVIDPALKCICVTPVCPVSRYACPLVFAEDTILEVSHGDDRSGNFSIILDGDGHNTFDMCETLVIKRSEKAVKMLSVKSEGFFEKLNSKISKYELKS